MSVQFHPTEPQFITPDWLTSLLRGVGAIEAARVQTHCLRSLPCQVQGIGLAEVVLSYDVHEAGCPRTLVAAYADPDPGVRRLHHDLGNYVRVVQEVADAIEQDRGAMPCLTANMDPRTGGMLIILGDPAWQPYASLRLLDTFERLSMYPAASRY